MGTVCPARMVKYAKEAENPTKSCKARGSDLRVHFKNTRESALAIKNMQLDEAKSYRGCARTPTRHPLPPILRWRRTHRAGEEHRQHERTGALAEEELRVPPGSAQERREQRRGEGTGHRCARHQPHPGEPGAEAEAKDVPCARTHQPVHELALPR